MNKKVYDIMRANGIGASFAFTTAKILNGIDVDSTTMDFVIRCAVRPHESRSIREDIAARRADARYCMAYDC